MITRRATTEFLLEHLVWFLLAAMLCIFSATVPRFFQIEIFANIVEHSTFVGVMAIGLAIIIIAGNMDLSVESVAALAAMTTGILFASHGVGLGIAFTPEWLVFPVSLLIALTVGGVIGALNGFLVVVMQMNAFIVTLASYIWVRGLVVAVSGGRSAQDLPPALRFIGGASDCLDCCHVLRCVFLPHGKDTIWTPRDYDWRQFGRHLSCWN